MTLRNDPRYTTHWIIYFICSIELNMVIIASEFEPAKVPDSERYEGTDVDPNIFASETPPFSHPCRSC